MSDLSQRMDFVLAEMVLMEAPSPLSPEHPSYKAIMAFHSGLARHPKDTQQGRVARANHIQTHLSNPEFQGHLQKFDPSGQTHKALYHAANAAAKVGSTGAVAKAQ